MLMGFGAFGMNPGRFLAGSTPSCTATAANRATVSGDAGQGLRLRRRHHATKFVHAHSYVSMVRSAFARWAYAFALSRAALR